MRDDVFEFDPAKSAANKAKHGVDFVEAQALWLDERVLGLGVMNYAGEERTLLVGEIDGRCWTAVVTNRSGSIRIISVRRARHSEEAAYQRG